MGLEKRGKVSAHLGRWAVLSDIYCYREQGNDPSGWRTTQAAQGCLLTLHQLVLEADCPDLIFSVSTLVPWTICSSDSLCMH